VRGLIAKGELDEAASLLLEVVAFVTVNIITTFQQLLIRYDVSDWMCIIVVVLLGLFLSLIQTRSNSFAEITTNIVIIVRGVLSQFQRDAMERMEPTAKCTRSYSSGPWVFRKLEGVEELEKEILSKLQQQQQQQQTNNNTNDDVEKHLLKKQDFSIQMQGFLHLLEKTDRSLHKAVCSRPLGIPR